MATDAVAPPATDGSAARHCRRGRPSINHTDASALPTCATCTKIGWAVCAPASTAGPASILRLCAVLAPYAVLVLYAVLHAGRCAWYNIDMATVGRQSEGDASSKIIEPRAAGEPVGGGILPARFNHVAFRVRDVPRSLAFYEGVLGFREAFRVHHPDGRLGLIYVQFGADQFIELFEGGDAGHQPDPAPAGSGYLHFCLTVEDLDASLETLRKKGIPAGPSRTGTSGARICFIEDPDGNKIELAELNAASQTRQAAARDRWLQDHPEG